MRRAKLSLCSNQFSDHYRRKVARKTREQLGRAGLRTLADLRTKVLAERVRAMGWPPNVCFREAQILSLIWERGPMTRREICLALGMPLHEGERGVASRLMMHANEPGGTYTATLMRKGLLISLGRKVRHPDCGKGNRAGQARNVCLYSLPLNIKRRRTDSHEERQRKIA